MIAVVVDGMSTDEGVGKVADDSADATEVVVLELATVDRHVPQTYGNVSTCPLIVAVTGRPHD